MTDEDRVRMADKLRSGGAALAVMCDDFEVEATQAEMARAGGEPESYGMPEATIESISTAAAIQSAAADAVDEAASALDADFVEDAARSIGIDLPASGAEEEKFSAVTAGILATTGLSATDVAKAREAGVDRPSKLLEMAATPDGRKALSDETGIAPEKVLAAVKLLDLMRIKGIGIKNARLLEAAGVTTVPDLAQRNAGNLQAAVLEEANAGQDIVATVPYEETVAAWVAQAKDLPLSVT